MPLKVAGLWAGTAGELSPRMFGRVDFDRYDSGFELVENFRITPQGPIERRTGTRFLGERKGVSRIFPFRRSNLINYIIEAGAGYFRFFINEGRLVTNTSISAVSNNGGEFQIESVGHDLITGCEVEISGADLNDINGTWTITRIDDDNFTLDGSTFASGWTVGGTVVGIFEVANNFTEDDITGIEIDYTQSADVFYVSHPDYMSAELKRFGATTWTFTDVNFIDGPYESQNTTDTTVTIGAASGTGVSMTFSATEGVNNGDGLKATDVGRLLRVSDNTGSVGYGVIASVTNPTTGTIDIEENVPTSAVKFWRLGAFSDTTGYAEHLGFFEQRFVATKGQNVYMTQSGQFDNFAPTEYDLEVIPSNALYLAFADSKTDEVVWIIGDEVLMLGTTGGEWKIQAGRVDEGLTAENGQNKAQDYKGSSIVKPVRAEGRAMFIGRSGNKLYGFSYNFEKDKYEAEDLTLLADHIFKDAGGCKRLAYTEEPDNVLAALCNDGTVKLFTYKRLEKVAAWTRMVLGGDPFVDDIASIPSPDGKYDTLYLATTRTINGQTKRYIEYTTPQFSPTSPTDKDDMYFVDCGLTYDGSPTTLISGLEHLEGETVRVVGDGKDLGNKVVSSGTITLDNPHSVVHAGYGYTSLLKTLKEGKGGYKGIGKGRKTRVVEAFIEVYDSISMKYGAFPDGKEYNVENLLVDAFRTLPFKMDDSPDLVTGFRNLVINDSWDERASIYIAQDKPYPLNIRSIIIESNTEDD